MTAGAKSRTFRDVETDTIVAERAGVLGLARVFAAQVEQLVAAGRVPGPEATVLKDRIRAFADGIATGLHREGHDHPAVRAAMREVMRRGAQQEETND